MLSLLPFVMVPQREVMIIERFGRFSRKISSGLGFKIPIFENVAYSHSLKEQVHEISEQTAITADNVKIKIDGVLYFKITDPEKASYVVKDPIHSIALLAQTSMRSEIGLLELDRTFEERDYLNVQIKAALNEAGNIWGIEVQRYEIKDIHPPEQIRRSMELQAEAERIKRSKILESEGDRQSAINKAEAYKRSQILEGEGKAMSIKEDARSIVETLQNIGQVIKLPDGNISDEVIRMRLSEQYVNAMEAVYRNSKIVSLPETDGDSNANNSSALSPDSIATALTLYKQLIGSGNQTLLPTLENFERQVSQDENLVNQLLKHNQGGQSNSGSQSAAPTPMQQIQQQRQNNNVRYMDDKVLYQ